MIGYAGTPKPSMPRWHATANACLIGCSITYPGRDSAAGWNIARRLGQQFQALADDGDPAATFAALKAALLTEYARLPLQTQEVA